MSSVKNRISMEATDFQSGLFHHDLTIAVEKLRAGGSYETDAIAAAGFSEIIKRHTNMSIDVFVKNNFFGACVEMPKVDKNHPLVPDELKRFQWRETRDAINALGRAMQGSVDRKNSKVGGDFANLDFNVFVSADLMRNKKFSDGEISAIILHECGHIFTFFEFLGYTFRSNLVMAGVRKTFMDTKDIKERKMTLALAEKHLGIEFNDMDAVAATKNSDMAEAIIISETARRMRSEVGENLYEVKSTEQVADEFAARHGAARDIVTGLEKLYRLYGHRDALPVSVYLALEALKLTVFTVLMVGLTPMAALLAIMTYPSIQPHDDPQVRVGKMKNQLIHQLKQSDVPGDLREQINEDIELIKAVEADLARRRTFYEFLVEVIVPKRRRMKKQNEIQVELEELAANELYLAASKFEAGASNA